MSSTTERITAVHVETSGLQMQAPRLTAFEKVIAAAAAGPLPSVKEAKAIHAEFRGANGRKAAHAPLLTDPGHNTKLGKSLLPTYGWNGAPHRSAGVGNMCTSSTKGCRAACLYTAGRAEFTPVVNEGRVLRTRFAHDHASAFVVLLPHEIEKAERRHGRIGQRMNVVTDARWELCFPELFDRFPRVQFYDYTSHDGRWVLPPNYHLTRSAKETTTDAQIVASVERGRNVTVVFDTPRGRALPSMFLGFPVIDGDLSDERFLDPRGVIVGLRAKGAARFDTSGFVKAAS